jgi:hypothetical protein
MGMTGAHGPPVGVTPAPVLNELSFGQLHPVYDDWRASLGISASCGGSPNQDLAAD